MQSKKEGQNSPYQVKQLNELFKAHTPKRSCWLVSFTKQPMNNLCNHSKILPKYRRTQRRESFFSIQKSNGVILYDCLRRCRNIYKIQTHFQYKKRKNEDQLLYSNKSTYKLPLLSVIFYDISLNISFKINNNTEVTLTLEVVAVIQ